MSTRNLIDLTGKKFGMLTVVDRSENRNHHVFWNCACDCGVQKIVAGHHLSAGATKSCGCVNRVQGGKSGMREYAIWSKMLMRCYRKDNDNYRYYGGVGVYVCKRWRESFLEFFADMGIAPSAKHSIDRINSNGGSYTCGKCDECRESNSPANCRWATKAVQVRNQKNNRYYTHDGKTLILKDWARLVGLKYLTLWNRINIGIPFEQAISVGLYDRKSLKQVKLQ